MSSACPMIRRRRGVVRRHHRAHDRVGIPDLSHIARDVTGPFAGYPETSSRSSA